MSDPLFAKLPHSARIEVLAQIDPKFARMNRDQREAFLWKIETIYLPKAQPPKQIFSWTPNDPASTTKVVPFRAITKVASAGGFVIEASIERRGFFVAHIRILNQRAESIPVRPQTFVLDVSKPKHHILFFEYPSRVGYQYLKAGLNYSYSYAPTERTTIRSATGQTIATVDTPDALARQDMRDAVQTLTDTAFSIARNIEPRSLKEGDLPSGSSVEGDVYFERNDKARELVLRIVVADVGFEIPFSFPKR